MYFNNQRKIAGHPACSFALAAIIRANSLAEIAGLQESDELVSIDGIDASKIRLGALIERMRAGNGTKVALELQLGNEILSVVLTLRRRI